MRRAVAHVFVDDLARPALSDQDVHHFSRVLRLRPGEVVSVSDGRGGSRLCEWDGRGARAAERPDVGATTRAADSRWLSPSQKASTPNGPCRS